MKAQDFRFNEEMLELIPEASPSDKLALEEDIKNRVKMFGADDQNILIQDILLDPAGLVIDGRTRVGIFEKYDLEIPKNKIRKLPYGTTKERILMEIRSANNRRNLTITQKAMIAAKLYLKMKQKKEKGIATKKIAEENGVGDTTLKNALYIKDTDNDVAEALWKGNSVDIVNEHGKQTTTTSINSVRQYLQREKEKALNTRIDSDHEWDPYAYIKTQTGKDWYKKLMKENSGVVDTPIQKIISDYINEHIKQDKLDSALRKKIEDSLKNG